MQISPLRFALGEMTIFACRHALKTLNTRKGGAIWLRLFCFLWEEPTSEKRDVGHPVFCNYDYR